MSSLVDVVDKTDTLTGVSIDSDEAHDKNLAHRCVAVFVFDMSGRLYLQVHKVSGGKLDHSVGGHVDSGEDYITAAKREMAEEINIEGVNLQTITEGYYSPERSRTHMFGIYECTAPKDWVFVPNDEVEEIYPEALEDIVLKMNKYPENFTGGFINTMAKYLAVKDLPYVLDHENITKDWRTK